MMTPDSRTVTQQLCCKQSILRSEISLFWRTFRARDFLARLTGTITRLGHVLTQEKYQLAALIPSCIMKYSMERAASVNMSDSLALLVSVDRLIAPSDYSRLEETTDHVIWLVFEVAEAVALIAWSLSFAYLAD